MDAVSKVSEVLAKQLGAPSPESGAIEASAHAQLFIFAPPVSFRNDEGHIVASIEEMLRDMERGHTYIAALAPWIDEVKKRDANEEQLQFLHEVGLDGAPDEKKSAGEDRSTGDESMDDKDDGKEEHQPPPLVATLPEPAQAVSILERLLPRYDAKSANYAFIELALKTMQFLIDTNQTDAFCTFLDEIHKPHSLTGADVLPLLPAGSSS